MSAKLLTAWVLSLSLTGLVLLSAAWSNPFVLDAVNKIRDNPDVRATELQWSTLFDAYADGQPKGSHLRNDPSRPLTYFCYWVLWKIGGGETWPFHAFALLLHMATSLMVGWLALNLLAGAPVTAVAASLLFLVHPLNVGTVFYPFALSDVLAAFFTCAILMLSRRPQSGGNDALCALALTAALAAKQSAVVIPALVWILSPRRRRLTTMLTGMALLYVVIRWIRFGGVGDMEAMSTYPAKVYALAQGAMILKYLGLLAWPVRQCLDHWVRPADFSTAAQVTAWGLILSITVHSLVGMRTSISKTLWLLFLIPLLPTSSLFPTTDLFVERRAYLSSAAIVLIIANFARSRRGARTAMAVAITACMGLSLKRTHDFNRPEFTFEETLWLYPDDVRSLGNLAALDLKAGRLAQAKDRLDQVLKVDSHNVDAMANLAALHQIPDSGFFDPSRSEALYRATLALDPNQTHAWRNLGFLKLSQRQFAEARECFERVLRLSPRDARALEGLKQSSASAP